MNFIPGQQDPQDPSAAPADGGADLNESLEQGDATFVTGEPKRQASPGTIGVAGLLALCAAGTYFMYVRGGPQAASAAETATATEVGTFLADGERHVALMKQMLQNTDKVVQQFRQSSTKTQIPLAALATNPFRMEAPKKAAGGNESESAARRRRDEERAAVVDAAKGLKLQLLMVGGARRAAMIDDRMVYEGQEVDGLTVEKILPDKVIFRSGVYRVEKVFQK